MISPQAKQEQTLTENQQLLNTKEVKIRRSIRIYIVCFLFCLTISGLLIFRPWSSPSDYKGEETPVVEETQHPDSKDPDTQEPDNKDPNTQDPDTGSVYEGYKLSQHWIGNDKSFNFLAGYMGDHSDYNGSPIIKEVHMIVSFKEKNTFRVKILDSQNSRWEIPESYPFPHFSSDDTISYEDSCCSMKVQTSPFTFVINRKDNGEVLFDTRNKTFIYSDLYIELSTSLPSQNLYGFGERNYKFKLTPGIYTIWGRDDAMIIEDGKGGKNTYSHHPVGLVRDSKGSFFLTLMRNSNAMDIIVNDEPGLTYKMVGGVIDLIFFIGDDYPETVLKAYHNYLGNFTMMPFWSLGYHQSKWGYSTQGIMQGVVEKYISNDIPLDVIWSDIDYMVNKEIFTIDESRYPLDRMKAFTTQYKKRWVPIIDPGVKKEGATGPGAKEGLNRDIFIKNYKGNNLVGSVWPGKVYFPDFFNPNTDQYWADMLDVLYKKVPFAGIWLDMNELANFVDGEDSRWDQSKYDNIPYIPGSRPLKRKTVSLDAVHYGKILEYNVHGLFSLMENEATHKYLATKSKLPFILTRSTSMGMGRFSAHWTGDNGATWEYLQLSIPGNFNFQIFGIPFVGADICGFMKDSNAELCARWTQLGALYPFARNHHEIETRNQEPWTFPDQGGISVLETSRIAIKTRYSLLKWYYSLFIETRGAGSIFRPLMFEFPYEEVLYNDGYSDWEFLLGKGVLCTPKVESGEPYVNAYFPIANWFDFFNGTKVISQDQKERVQRVETPFNASAPMFLRGGFVAHRQNVSQVLSTEDLNDEFELIAALEKDAEGKRLQAFGSIMGIKSFDDNVVNDKCIEKNCLININMTVTSIQNSSVTIRIDFKKQSEDKGVTLDGFGLSGIRLYGLALESVGSGEDKDGSVLVNLERAQISKVFDLKSLDKEAFLINFGEVLRVQDGDSLVLTLML